MDGAIDWVHKEKRLKVILEDVDGGANGGEFATAGYHQVGKISL